MNCHVTAVIARIFAFLGPQAPHRHLEYIYIVLIVQILTILLKFAVGEVEVKTTIFWCFDCLKLIKFFPRIDVIQVETEMYAHYANVNKFFACWCLLLVFFKFFLYLILVFLFLQRPEWGLVKCTKQEYLLGTLVWVNFYEICWKHSSLSETVLSF